MKKTVYFLLLISTINSAYSQTNDSILFGQLSINGFSISQIENSLASTLGTPSSVDNYENEIDKETWIDYKFFENSFYFFENKMVSFNLKNDTYYFYNPSIKVGNSITNIANLFPSSYSNREILNGLGFIVININMPDGSISDIFIVINYNPSTYLISSIHIGSK